MHAVANSNLHTDPDPRQSSHVGEFLHVVDETSILSGAAVALLERHRIPVTAVEVWCRLGRPFFFMSKKQFTAADLGPLRTLRDHALGLAAKVENLISSIERKHGTHNAKA